MVRRNTPTAAANRYLEPFQRAMGCIAHGTLFTVGKRDYVVGEVNAILLNNNDPYPIRTNPTIYLSASQRFRVVEEPDLPEGPFRVYTVEYFYQFADAEREVLTFHWTPEATGETDRTYPHLHVGAGLVTEPPSVFPKTFHKLHVPTGRVSFESIILFAIDELGVKAIPDNYHEILGAGQRQFGEYRRKP